MDYSFEGVFLYTADVGDEAGDYEGVQKRASAVCFSSNHSLYIKRGVSYYRFCLLVKERFWVLG